jgi:hypothetical protein
MKYLTKITEKPVHTLTLEALDQVKWKEILGSKVLAETPCIPQYFPNVQ